MRSRAQAHWRHDDRRHAPDVPARPGARAPARFLPLGIAAWLVLEIWLLTVVAGAAGGLTVFLLLVAGLVLGAVVIKRAGRRALRNLTETLQQQQGGRRRRRSSGSSGNGLTDARRPAADDPGADLRRGWACCCWSRRSEGCSAAPRSAPSSAGCATAAPGTLGDAFQQARMHRPGRQGRPGRGHPRGRARPRHADEARPPLTG